MASRDFLKHVVSTSEPVGSGLGDEYYNPSSNKLFKRLAVNGTSVQWVERQQAIAVQSSGTTVATGARTINFPGATIGYDSVTDTVTIQSSGIPGGTNTNIQFNNSGAFAGSSNLTWNNGTQTLAVTGFLTAFALSRSGNVNAPTWTTTSPVFNSAAALLTDVTGSGTIALKVGHSFLSPNFASSSLTTITDAVNLYVNANVASTNTTITNNWSLYVAGNQRVTGTLFADSQITGSISGTAANVTGTVAIGNGGTGAITAPLARTALGATTLGSNLFTLVNVAAISFPRINADNTVSSLDAAAFRTAIGVGAGSGTVTSVSVTSANGFAGTVATSTSTPAITISTSITGVLKGNATAISAAVAGTDYQAPIGTISGIAKGNGANALTAAVAGTDYVAPAGTFFIGTTSIAHNRASASLSMTGVNIDGSAGSASTATASTYSRTLQQTDGTTYLVPVDPRAASGSRATSLNANQYAQGLFSEFKNSGTFGFSGNYSGLITYANWVGTTASTGDPTYQLLFSPSGVNATANPSLRFRAGIDTTWGAWGEISHTQKTNLDLQHNSLGVGVAASTTAGQLSVSYQAALNTTTPGLTRYGLHLQGQTTADQANGITWNGGTGTTAAQAGIYVQGSGSYGTKMYIATTDSYATGSQTAISIDHLGAVQIARNNLTVNLGYIIESTATSLTAAGTTQGTALQLARQINDVTVVAASSGVRLPVAVAGMRIIVRNSSVTNLNVYPNTGAQIQTLGANVAMVLVSATMLEYVAVSATQWYLMNSVFA
jgi:hypothetical protein